MQNDNHTTLGLAFSGSGNRTTFYIGFLEVLTEAGIKADYISACSGGSVVASAYACGTLGELKALVMQGDSKYLLKLITQKRGNGGLYTLEAAEKVLYEQITAGKTFEEVRPMMSFSAVDIENSELVDLCMGDIARAAMISCTTPGLFEPVKWGNRLLVDGGLLSMVPIESLKKFKPSVTICIDLAYTRHIFPTSQINIKKFLNQVKEFLFIEQLGELFKKTLSNKQSEYIEKDPKLLKVWGKSLDIAIQAGKARQDIIDCDLMIVPREASLNRTDLRAKSMERYYFVGREFATKYLPEIKALIKAKS